MPAVRPFVISTVLRLLLMLVLAAGPLVASAMAEEGRWSRVRATPVDGTVQGVEEEPAGNPEVEPTPEEAALWAAAPSVVAVSPWRYRLWSRLPPAPPHTGDPTPPPETV